MGLSSNILWHQTNYKNLISILREKKLRFSYSLEQCFSMYDEKGLAFPMVSMCDFPFSEITTYMGKYGNSILGLRRDWGIRKGFCPVWYCFEKSEIIAFLFRYYKKLVDRKQDGGHGILFQLLSYMKPVEGELVSRKYKTYRFYDEREVRLVPKWEKTVFENREVPILLSKDYEKFKKMYGNSLLDIEIDFDWNDIKYIVVDKMPQVKKVRSLLKALGCSNENVMIFDSGQIKDDFIGTDHNQKFQEDEESAALSEQGIKDVINSLLE